MDNGFEPRHAWDNAEVPAAVSARKPGQFVDEQIRPLLFRQTFDAPRTVASKIIGSDKEFWKMSSRLLLREIHLDGFRVTDWFPRTPGVFWSGMAQQARRYVYDEGLVGSDNDLGRYFSPQGKLNLIENGGIGAIRLRPRRIDGIDCWLATAVSGAHCHGGVPLAIPVQLMQKADIGWGETTTIEGRVRFLQDAGLEDLAASVHHARPLIIFVDSIKRDELKSRKVPPIFISPVALFQTNKGERGRHQESESYTFVQCLAGNDSQLDRAGSWIEKYAHKFSGRIITNFDEQRPMFADAPLSYQRLVAKTYEKTIIENFHGSITANQINAAVENFEGSISTTNIGNVVDRSVRNYEVNTTHMQNNTNIGGSGIVNINSTLSNVNQTISSSPGLTAPQKKKLDALVKKLRDELDVLKESHADEVQAIVDALGKTVTLAAKPEAERKKNLLDLSATGLRNAAELLKDVAPTVLTTAGLVANFIAGL